MTPERARELLARERSRIEHALAGLAPSRDDDSELSHTDPADAATELAAQELDAGLVEHMREELAALERAEARLAAGTYGRSIESGDPISDARLEAVPTAERTVEEQARRDRVG